MSTNPYSIVDEFEDEVATFTGAPFAVAVNSCTAALHLCLLWAKRQDDARWSGDDVRWSGFGISRKAESYKIPYVEIPEKTFISVPTVAVQAGFRIKFTQQEWQGWYKLDPLPIWDSALRLRKGMYHGTGTPRTGRAVSKSTSIALQQDREPKLRYVCLSFQYRKHLPIGRGGMILHNDPEFDEWARRMRFYGRDPVPLALDPGPEELGYRYYMTPDEAARGLCFLHRFEDDHDGSDIQIDYPSLASVPAFQQHLARW